jgi:hypothetical protein
MKWSDYVGKNFILYPVCTVSHAKTAKLDRRCAGIRWGRSSHVFGGCWEGIFEACVGSLTQSLAAFLTCCTNAVAHRLMDDSHVRQALPLEPRVGE